MRWAQESTEIRSSPRKRGPRAVWIPAISAFTRVFDALCAGMSGVSFFPPSVLRRLLLSYADHHAAALADRKPLLLLHRERRDQLNVHGRVVARHDHLRPRWQRALPGHVRRAEVKLRTVIVEERRVPAPLLLGQDIRLRLELLVRLHRPRLAQDLPALDRVLVDPAQQTSHIVPRNTLVQKLAEHLNP